MLEHGNVVITYEGLSELELDDLKKYVKSKNELNPLLTEAAEAGNSVFLTPWKDGEGKGINLLAWTKKYRLTEWDGFMAERFVGKWLDNTNNFGGFVMKKKTSSEITKKIKLGFGTFLPIALGGFIYDLINPEKFDISYYLIVLFGSIFISIATLLFTRK